MKFFRKIRQHLLSEGKTIQYVKYAIGEIVLVVIGILIAVQINNWNEQRKANNQELALMKQLHSDLTTNLNEVIELNKRLNVNKYGIDSLVIRLNENRYDFMVPVFLNQALRKSGFNNARSGYNLMQNGKSALVSDEAVLKSVLNIYENDIPDIFSRQQEMKNSINYIQIQFINKLFIKSPQNLNIKFNNLDIVATDLYEPIDFDALTKNIEFTNTVIQLGKLVETRLAYLGNTENELKKTVTLLDSKLDVE